MILEVIENKLYCRKEGITGWEYTQKLKLFIDYKNIMYRRKWQKVRDEGIQTE